MLAAAGVLTFALLASAQGPGGGGRGRGGVPAVTGPWSDKTLSPDRRADLVVAALLDFLAAIGHRHLPRDHISQIGKLAAEPALRIRTVPTSLGHRVDQFHVHAEHAASVEGRGAGAV